MSAQRNPEALRKDAQPVEHRGKVSQRPPPAGLVGVRLLELAGQERPRRPPALATAPECTPPGRIPASTLAIRTSPASAARSGYEAPAGAVSSWNRGGYRALVVNGAVLRDDGETTGTRAGEVLRPGTR